MKTGFLLQQQGSKAPFIRDGSAQDASGSAGQLSEQQGVASSSSSSTEPATQASAATPEQVAAGLEECLELLRGPSDERRFVGLLLVTKLLPAGNDDTIKRVHEAVGPAFLTRLLLPLRTAGPPSHPDVPDDAAAQQQQEAAQCGLGLAVLSSCARVRDLASSKEMLEKLPLVMNVVRAGGVSPLLAARWARAAGAAGSESSSGETGTPQPAAVSDAAADAAAVLDALECAVAAARSGPEGRAVAAECGAAASVAAVLQASPPSATQHCLLAVQLLAAVVAGQGREQLLVGCEGELKKVLPALARIFALPADRLGGISGGNKEEQFQLQQAQLAVQLEALHVLLLLLPLPHTASLPEQLLAPSAAWPAQLRRGLTLLLRGRVSAVQRHSALQLAGGVLELLGPEWLLGGRPEGADSQAAAGVATEVEAFFQVLVEVTKVETSVLLHDALAPAVPVPLASFPGTAAADWHPPPPRTHAADVNAGSEAGDSLPDSAGAELAAELAGGGQEDGSVPADVQPLVRILHSEQDQWQLEQQLQQEEEAAAAAVAGGGKQRVQQQGEHMKRVDDTPIPTDMRWEGPSEASGARAARVLPTCFALLEAAVEALALDTQRAEAMEVAEGGGGGDDAPPPPALSACVAQRALSSLQEAVEVVLQFIEQIILEEVAEGGDGCSEAAHQPLMLAALRVVGRFCAEVPDAFADRLRPLLPFLLSLRAGPGKADADLLVPAEGITFLLPLLLQVTDPAFGVEGGACRSKEQQLWLDALAQPAVMPQLVQYTCDCTVGCTSAVTTGAAAEDDAALIYASQLLLNLVAAEPGSVAVSGVAAAKQQQRHRQLILADGTQRLLRELLRVARLRPVVSPAHCSPHQLVATARLSSTVAALAGAAAASAAVELAAGSEGGNTEGGSLDHQLQQRLRPIQERKEQLEARKQQEEACEKHWWLHHGMREPRPLSALPFLGPFSGKQLLFLCSQLLSAMQVTVQLTCSEAHLRQLIPKAVATGADASPAMACLVAARSAVAADVALQAEFRRNLDALASEAVVMLQCYPPFQAMCNDYSWAKAEVVFSRRSTRAATVATAAGSGGGSLVAEDSPSLKLFVKAAVVALG